MSKNNIDLTELAELSSITKRLEVLKSEQVGMSKKANRPFHTASFQEKFMLDKCTFNIQQLEDKREKLKALLLGRCINYCCQIITGEVNR